MGKVHKSFRVDEQLAAAVSALGAEGETEAALYNRVIAAGVEALSAQGDDDVGQHRADSNQDAALISSLQGHIETLKAVNASLSEQMAVKDKQIEALSVLTAQAQQATAKALEAPQQPQAGDDGADTAAEEQKRGFWARFFG